MGTLFNKKIIYTLESPIWLHKAGMTKGLSHDRQHLGFILSAKSDLQIRQVNDAVDKPLTLRLLNTDSKTEKSFSVGHEWITVNNSSHSVPFIDTPYFNEQPMVEYRYPEGSKVLPVYCKFDDETAFFEQWDHQGSEFSVICSDYFLMLVPQQDKVILQQLRSFKTIDELIDHYEKAMIFYNDLAGISFYPKKVTDKNIHNKYFIKADQHGIGAAYYGGSWTAANSSSIADFWLNDIDHDWGHL